MTRTVTVRWEITEQHSATVEVPDDFTEDDIDDSFLAECEDNGSWDATTERDLLEFTINDSNDEKAGA